MSAKVDPIARLEAMMTRKFNRIHKDFDGFKKDVDDRLAPLHDFMIGQQAIAANGSTGDTGITKELLNIVKWLILIIAGFMGIKLL